MRPLLLAAVLLVPAAAAALDTDALKQRYLSFRSPQDRLAPEDFPAPLRPAAEPVLSVQLGCAAPCADAESRRLYGSMLDLAAERLALTPQQAEAARALYMPDGSPRLRSPLFRADDPALTRQAQERMVANTGRLAAALGTLQGPGDLPATGPGALGAFAGAGPGRRPTAEELARLNAQAGAQLPATLAFAGPGSLPAPSTRRGERLHETMYAEMRGNFSDPAMQQGLRCVLRRAEEQVKSGRFDGGTGPFGAMYAHTNRRGQVILAAKDLMMDYRSGYGGGDVNDDGGFERHCGVKLDAAQRADLDHFFFGAHTGTIPVVGTAMCAGGVGFWDGLKPLFCDWREPACQDSIAYNWKQLGAGFKGCAAGTAITKASLGLRRGS